MKIDELYNKYKDNIISVYLCGSALLQMFDTIRDIDYMILVKDKSQLREMRQYCQDNCGDDLRIDLHIYDENAWNREKEQLPIWSYLYHFLDNSKPLYGEQWDFNIDILKQKERYKEVLKTFKIKTDYERACSWLKYIKSYYYIFIGTYILYYNSYDLPDTAISMIQRAHDKQLTEDDLQTFQPIFDEVINHD